MWKVGVIIFLWVCHFSPVESRFIISIKYLPQYNNNDNNNNKEVTANRPDIIIKNKKEKTCTLIDVAIPAERNAVQKEAERS